MAALIKNDSRMNRMGDGGSLPNRSVMCIWHLATDDSIVHVEADGYFDNFADVLEIGEPIMASMAVGSDPVLKFYIVATNDGQAVTISAAE